MMVSQVLLLLSAITSLGPKTSVQPIWFGRSCLRHDMQKGETDPHLPTLPECSTRHCSLDPNGPDRRGALTSLKGVAFMTVLAFLTVLAVLVSTMPPFCLSYEIHHNEATVAVLTVWRFRR